MFEILQADDLSPVTDLPLANAQAGAQSDAVELHLWNSQGEPAGQPVANAMALFQAEDPARVNTFLSTGLPPLDELWGRVRVIGFQNPGDASWSIPTTDWQPWGAHRPLVIGDSPVILYERHWFRRLTDGRWSKPFPELSGPRREPGTYGTETMQHQYLAAAQRLDWRAAHQSCSFGLFQVMGFNWQRVGFASLGAFVESIWTSADAHFDAFVGYIRHRGLVEALRVADGDTLGRGFNGRAYAQHGWHTRFAEAIGANRTYV